MANTKAHEFGEWIEAQLAMRRWDQAELASRSKLDPGLISRLINGERTATVEVCIRLAATLRLPRAEVFVARGWLTKASEADFPTDIDPRLVRMVERLDQWTPAQLDIVFPLLVAAIDAVERAQNLEPK